MHESHSWKRIATPPTIRAHSLEKHKLLGAYLTRYIETLTQNIKIDQLNLTLVDGFAGGNVYLNKSTGERISGSPSIVIKSVRDADIAANQKRKKPFAIFDDYFFIEKDAGAYESLKRSLADSEQAGEVRGETNVLRGEFTTYIPRIVDFISKKRGGGRSIFVLDQCGYDQVPFETIRTILATLPRAEVILTFAADFLIDYLREKEPNRRLASLPSLDLDALAASCDRSAPQWRRVIQMGLHSQVQAASGAKFYTPFFIHSVDSHKDLWLLHLSGHPRARDVMVGLHWQHQNSFAHYGGAGLKMLGYHPGEDVAHTKQPYLNGFLFDGPAKALTEDALLDELPARIFDHMGEISFNELFSSISNETPATSEILRKVIKTLAEDNIIRVKDETGDKLRAAGVRRGSDIIFVPSQRRLFF